MNIVEAPKDPAFIKYMKKLFGAGADFEAFLSVLYEIKTDTTLNAMQRQALIRTVAHDQAVQYALALQGMLPNQVPA